jgi:hypothetical protein
VRSVFCDCNLSFFKSKLLVLATNDFDLVAETNNFDFGLRFLFFSFNGIFLNLELSEFNKFSKLYNNNFLFINYYIIYYYIYLILMIYWCIFFFLELINSVLNLKIYEISNLSL